MLVMDVRAFIVLPVKGIMTAGHGDLVGYVDQVGKGKGMPAYSVQLRIAQGAL